MKTINFLYFFTVRIHSVIFSRNLEVLYQAYTNKGSLKLYLTEVSDYASIIRTFIGKLKLDGLT